MKKIFLLIIILALPVPALAKEKFAVLSSENVLSITGTCTIDVRVILTPVGDSKKEVYSSGAPCRDKTFSFSDDLTRWNLPEGQYTFWVNGEPSTKRMVIKKIIVEPVVENTEPAEPLPPKNTFEKALNDFGNSLKQASASLGVMEENLSVSDYAGDTVKRTLIGFLRTALDTVSQFFTDLKDDGMKEHPSEVTIPQEETSAAESVPDTQLIIDEVTPAPESTGVDIPSDTVQDQTAVPSAEATTNLTDVPADK